MKFTLSWLKEHLETDADAATIADTLTRIGLEVESVDDPAEALAPFTIAQILTAAPHPQADKLQVLTVDTGSGDPVQVVCGAPNARAGLKGVFGAPGAYVPGSDLTLKVAAIRGVESRGMMCSVRELQLGDEHDGIIELAADAPVGAAFADWAALGDPVIDIAVTPNRQDAMGVHGIARDLAAAGLGRLRSVKEILEASASPSYRRRPVSSPTEELDPGLRRGDDPASGDELLVQGSFPCPVEIRTDDPAGCPAFYGCVVRGVRNGPSPAWLQQRLKAVGQRPINALVDITNFIMLAYARPLHVYDLATLKGALVARKARDGEELLALNGKTYRLDPSMTVIADDAGVHDIGGIMGGEHSGVTEATTDVVIECAFFDPETIARTGQSLALASDARTRFERGVDPAFLDTGLALAARMVVELAGGEVSQFVRAGAPPLEARTLHYDPSRCEALAGVSVADARQREVLERLGFSVEAGDSWTIGVPSWRRDVDGAADIVEEVIRIEGLDKIPSTPLPRSPGVARPTATAEQLLERRMRRAAASRGLAEAVTWSFISEVQAELFGGSAWILANPISEDMRAMRPSLLPGLLAAAQRNMARGAKSVRLFELGRRYLAGEERTTLGIVLAGDRAGRDWRGGKAQAFDAFDAKAEVQALLQAAGAPVANLQTLPPESSAFHPGRSARLGLGPKNALALFGELHPSMVKAFDLEGAVVAAEIYLDAIPARRGSGRMREAYAPPVLQSVERDFAFLVPEETAAEGLLRAIRGADKAAIVDARLFDVFQGQGVPAGQKSLAIEVILQPVDKSFTDEELKVVSDRIVAAAAKLGAQLRG